MSETRSKLSIVGVMFSAVAALVAIGAMHADAEHERLRYLHAESQTGGMWTFVAVLAVVALICFVVAFVLPKEAQK